MKASWIYNVLLEAILTGVVASVFMAYAALNHNPQNEFYDTVTGRVVAENLLPMMLSWFLACALAYGVLRVVITIALRKLWR